MRLGTLADLAAARGVRLPDALTDHWPPRLHATDERGWFRFQRLYDLARSCVRGESAMRRVVTEAAADDAAEGSRWLELQVEPSSYAPYVGGLTPALEIILDAAREASAATGIGIAAVETARGTLIHRAALDGERVAHYRIVAPTEWNFHPRGAFPRGLADMPARNEGEVRQAAALLAHALDPCVAYETRIVDA